MGRINSLSLPATILIGCVILGAFYYFAESNKQNSIERQEQAKSAQQELENKQNECESLSVGVKKKWSNVMGVTYDNNVWKDCVVTYTDTKTGEVQITPLKFMQDSK